MAEASLARRRARIAPGVRALAQRGRRLARRVRHAPGPRFCPICQSSIRQFAPHGIDPRPGARCPICSSLERHRLAWLFLRYHTDLMDRRPKRLLHFAPEPILTERFTAVPALRHVTADLADAGVSLRLDITRLPCATDSFDAVYCSHVLEHVADDQRALAEIRGVLRPGGWALFQVPIEAEQTLEDPTVTDPEERLRRYGHPGHVRSYGPDFTRRLSEAGFTARHVTGADLATAADVDRYGLGGESLFFCT